MQVCTFLYLHLLVSFEFTLGEERKRDYWLRYWTYSSRVKKTSRNYVFRDITTYFNPEVIFLPNVSSVSVTDQAIQNVLQSPMDRYFVEDTA